MRLQRLRESCHQGTYATAQAGQYQPEPLQDQEGDLVTVEGFVRDTIERKRDEEF